MKATRPQMIEHFTLAMTAVAGITLLALAWKSKDGISVAVRASYFTYGILCVVGALAYYTKPRIGSAILIVTFLSSPVVSALFGFPAWVNKSAASRIATISGVIIWAVIVSAPFLESRDNGQA